MNRPLVRITLALAALSLAVPALAQSGMRLSWDHCAADGRVANKAFTCDTNAGSELLVLSYDPPAAKADCVGIEITMYIKSSSGVLPAWWQFSTGACRVTAFTHGLSPAAAGNCEFPFGPQFAGGIADFSTDWLGPGSLRVRALCAVPADQPWAITPGTEYFAFAVVLRHAKTVGTGACEGCTTPMCIGLGSMNIVDAQSAGNILLTAGGPNPGGGEAAVTWQGAYVREFTYPGWRDHPSELTCDSDDSSPTRRASWGAIKSLYR